MQEHSLGGGNSWLVQHFYRVVELVADGRNQLRAVSPQVDDDAEDAIRSGDMDVVREARPHAMSALPGLHVHDAVRIVDGLDKGAKGHGRGRRGRDELRNHRVFGADSWHGRRAPRPGRAGQQAGDDEERGVTRGGRPAGLEPLDHRRSPPRTEWLRPSVPEAGTPRETYQSVRFAPLF